MRRVGAFVYDDTGKTVLAEHTHGLWYRYIQGKHTMEQEPYPPSEQAQFEALPDALTQPISAGEETILRCAMYAISKRSGSFLPVSPRETKIIMDAVAKGVDKGLRKYGPFNPATEKRDLAAWGMEEARDLVTYCSMMLATPNLSEQDEAVLVRTIHNAVRAYLDLAPLSAKRQSKGG